MERNRGIVTAAEEMVASSARRQQRKTAAAAEKVAARDVHGAGGGEEAAATGTISDGTQGVGRGAAGGGVHMCWRVDRGSVVKEEVDMARRVLVAEAVTV